LFWRRREHNLVSELTIAPGQTDRGRTVRLGCVVTFITIAALSLTASVVEIIPVNNGAGWDGWQYLQYVRSLAQGEAIVGDPYRSVRLSGFLPLIAAATLSVSQEALVFIQQALNVLLLGVAAGLFFDTLIRLHT